MHLGNMKYPPFSKKTISTQIFSSSIVQSIVNIMTKADSKRVKGTLVERPIVYGTCAWPLPVAKKEDDSGHTHKWTVYVRGVNGEDISYYIKKVVFKLHDSFPSPTRTIDTFPYEITETGWGEFEMIIKIYFRDSSEKVMSFTQPLKLYPSVGTIQVDNYVIFENYEELIFNEPTENMLEILKKGPTSHKKGVVSKKNYTELERNELKVLDEAYAKIAKELAAQERKFTEVNEKLVQLKSSKK